MQSLKNTLMFLFNYKSKKTVVEVFNILLTN